MYKNIDIIRKIAYNISTIKKGEIEMTSKVMKTTVNGKKYEVWGDFILRAMVARNEDGEEKIIRRGGYLTNDLSIRKAIASSFGLASFRK